MTKNNSYDSGSKFFSSLFLLLVVALAGSIFFIWASPSTDVVPEVDMEAYEKEIAGQSNGQAEGADIVNYQPYKVIKKRPNFKVADALDAKAQKKKRVIKRRIRNARKLVDGKDPAEALNVLTELVEKHPDSYMGWMELGVTHLLNDFNLQAARQAFEKAARLRPNNRNTLEAIRHVYRELDDPYGAVGFFNQLAEEFPHAKKIKDELKRIQRS